MRRHINPISVEMGPNTTAADTCSGEHVQPPALDHQQIFSRSNSEKVTGNDDSPTINDNYPADNGFNNVIELTCTATTRVPEKSQSGNPVGMFGAGCLDGNLIKQTKTSAASPSQLTSQVKPTGLDLNVQYFPCKTCGSKFPSYYFVHKHRRLCHSEETSQDENNPSPNETTTKYNEATNPCGMLVTTAAADSEATNPCGMVVTTAAGDSVANTAAHGEHHGSKDHEAFEANRSTDTADVNLDTQCRASTAAAHCSSSN